MDFRQRGADVPRVTFGKFDGTLVEGRWKAIYLDGRAVGSIEIDAEEDAKTRLVQYVRYRAVGYEVVMDDEDHPLARSSGPGPTYATLAEAQQAVRDSFAPKGRVKS